MICCQLDVWVAGPKWSVANWYTAANGQLSTDSPQRNTTVIAPSWPSVSQSVVRVGLGVTVFCILALPRVTLGVITANQARIQKGSEGHAPNHRLSGFFSRKIWLCWDCSLHQKCSVVLTYAKNALAAGDPPQTPSAVTDDAPPNPLVGWGGRHPLPIPITLGDNSILAPSALSFRGPTM